jgi:hypothetical protein
MRVLIIRNRYQQPGGENAVYTEYERRYKPQINFGRLLAICRQALAAEGVRH